MGRLVDLELAADGYVTGPTGRPRRITAIERLAEETRVESVAVEWGVPLGGLPAIAYCWTRRIILANALFDADPVLMKSLWAHELSHIIVGQSEDRALQWQLWHYGDLLWPDVVTRIEG